MRDGTLVSSRFSLLNVIYFLFLRKFNTKSQI